MAVDELILKYNTASHQHLLNATITRAIGFNKQVKSVQTFTPKVFCKTELTNALYQRR